MRELAKNFLITNFAYGTGPYLRTTDLAIDFNDELEKRGLERMGVIIPWVYGERQKRVMLEEFRAHMDKYPRELLLDRKFGNLLRILFYANSSYKQALITWINQFETVSKEVLRHLASVVEVEDFLGNKYFIDGRAIKLELNRAPRVRTGIIPSYLTTFGYAEDILGASLHVPRREIALPEELLRKGQAIARRVEEHHAMRTVAYPGTFGTRENLGKYYPDDILVPPVAPLPKPHAGYIEAGIFVTITGIPGLERLYADARRLGIKLYSNDTEAVPGSVRALPHIISNPKTIFQFARSGWSSVWISMITGTPIVVPDFDPFDDPEIYFNNKAVEELGIGIVYRGQPLEEIIVQTSRVKLACKKICGEIFKRWGTLDGNRLSAKLFADHFLS